MLLSFKKKKKYFQYFSPQFEIVRGKKRIYIKKALKSPKDEDNKGNSYE